MFALTRFALSAAAILMLLSGCSSTTLTGSWRNPDRLEPVEKIYIVGVSKQEAHRRIFEDEFGRELQRFGVGTISSYRDLKAEEKEDLETVLAKVAGNGADSLLITRILSKRTEEVVNPGRVTGYGPDYYPLGGYAPRPYYRNYRDYYSRRYEMVYEPATVSQYKVITLESNLYDAATGDLIWAAQLETVIDGTLQTMVRDFIREVIKDLDKQGLI